MTRPLLEVQGLVKRYPPRRGGFRAGGESVAALNGIDLHLDRGETLALVGTSGSGKTTAGRCILRLERPDAGRVTFDGVDLLSLGTRSMRAMRRRIQPVFQNPDAALNPRMTAGALVGEPLAIHGVGGARERRARVAELLSLVGLSPADAVKRPAAFSGGQKQRIGIARALATAPELIVCDEPVTALDVSVQGQILNLLLDLQERLGVAYLFITHDLGLVRRFAHRAAVVDAGRIVEEGPVESLFQNPGSDATRRLIEAIPPLPRWTGGGA